MGAVKKLRKNLSEHKRTPRTSCQSDASRKSMSRKVRVQNLGFLASVSYSHQSLHMKQELEL